MWCSSWSLSGWSRATLAAARDPAVPRPTTAIFRRDLLPGSITPDDFDRGQSITACWASPTCYVHDKPPQS